MVLLLYLRRKNNPLLVSLWCCSRSIMLWSIPATQTIQISQIHHLQVEWGQDFHCRKQTIQWQRLRYLLGSTQHFVVLVVNKLLGTSRKWMLLCGVWFRVHKGWRGEKKQNLFLFVQTPSQFKQELVLILACISWSPDTATIKSKMVYASSKESIKRSFNGIGAEIQGTDYAEVSHESVLDKVSKGRA